MSGYVRSRHVVCVPDWDESGIHVDTNGDGTGFLDIDPSICGHGGDAQQVNADELEHIGHGLILAAKRMREEAR